MRWPWRFQFGLRTLLIALLLLPPLIAVQYRRLGHGRFWDAVSAARQRRDKALADWRVAYDAIGSPATNIAAVEDAERRYFAARQDYEAAYKVLLATQRNAWPTRLTPDTRPPSTDRWSAGALPALPPFV
jgi:hypothetical protein